MKRKFNTHQYDRILRENFHDCNVGLIRHLLGADSVVPIPLTDKLHYTLEHEADRFFLIDAANGQAPFIANIEWQVKNDPDMSVRMLVYHALRYKMSRMPVRGFVIYIGNEPLRMVSKLEHFHLRYAFDIVDLRSYTPDFFLQAELPEQVIMAVLTGFNSGEAKREIVRLILDKLHHLLGQQPLEFYRRVRQLEVLGILRDAQNIIIEEEQQMATLYELYDLKKDIRFLQGKEEGLAIGKRKWQKQGQLKGIREGMAIQQLTILEKILMSEETSHLSDQQIAHILGISEVQVAETRTRLNQPSVQPKKTRS